LPLIWAGNRKTIWVPRGTQRSHLRGMWWGTELPSGREHACPCLNPFVSAPKKTHLRNPPSNPSVSAPQKNILFLPARKQSSKEETSFSCFNSRFSSRVLSEKFSKESICSRIWRDFVLFSGVFFIFFVVGTILWRKRFAVGFGDLSCFCLCFGSVSLLEQFLWRNRFAVGFGIAVSHGGYIVDEKDA
jgi:hypothetical protein